MTRAKIIAGTIFVALCVTNALVYVFGLVPAQAHHPLRYFAQLLAMPATIAFLWGMVWLVVRLYYRRSSPPGPDYVRFYDLCMLAATAWLYALDLYLFVYIPLSGGDLDSVGYNRMLMVVGGIGMIGFGNVIPKLPYQKARNCFEVGMRRYYRLNRIGGWLLVLAGIVMTAFGILSPVYIVNDHSPAIVELLVALAVVPVLILWVRDIRAFRREDGLM